VVERIAHEIAAKAPSFTPAAGDAALHPRADIVLDGAVLGRIGFLRPAALRTFGLETPVVAAELELDALLKHWPPERPAASLPSMPAVERDLSVVLPEGCAWAQVESVVRQARAPHLESIAFTGTYRGKQTGADRKSLTMRLVFRDAARTLRREEVDLEVQAVVLALQSNLQAELRA
jgi:phenylalanyl-tRNA synthetase beta chain